MVIHKSIICLTLQYPSFVSLVYIECKNESVVCLFVFHTWQTAAFIILPINQEAPSNLHLFRTCIFPSYALTLSYVVRLNLHFPTCLSRYLVYSPFGVPTSDVRLSRVNRSYVQSAVVFVVLRPHTALAL